jgi:uncharacterized protein (UPF0332 family)
MLEDKELEIIKRNVEGFMKEEKIIVDKKNKGRFTNFFLENSKKSFDSAKLLTELSDRKELQEKLGYPNFDGYLWVINSSYYSMFYMARALLENSGVKIKTDFSTQSIHQLTFQAIVYFFYLNKKLEKKLIEDFQEASIEAGEILGKEKAKKLIEEYESEKEKRARFTYELGQIAMQNKARTSLERARFFNQEIKKILEIK